MTRGDGETVRAVRANLAAVADAPTAADYQALHDLVTAHGSATVARAHHAVVAERGGSGVLAALADTERVLAVVEGDPRLRDAAEEIAATAFHQACRLVLAGGETEAAVARARASEAQPPVPAGYDLAEWRAALAPVVIAPWAPYGDRLVERAAGCGPGVARLAAECQHLAQQLEASRERNLVATEIRRIIAETGLSQREFAAYVGTSASRLSTYATGRVVPSAAMLLRIQQIARNLTVAPRPSLVGVRSAAS